MLVREELKLVVELKLNKMANLMLLNLMQLFMEVMH